MRRPFFPVFLPLVVILLGACSTRPAASQPVPRTRAEISASLHLPKPKATYVIVHGAWGGGWAFRDVDALMTRDGYKVFRPTLTGQGERAHLASPDVNLSTHIQDIVNVIRYEDLHDIILVGHSYGGMVITGVADRIPERIKYMIYVDAFLPEDGESVNSAGPNGRNAVPRTPAADGFIYPSWQAPNTPPPADVPQSAKTFSEPIELKNPAVRNIPATYILTVDKGKQPQDDMFFKFYERAKARGWPTIVMEGDHNVQWSEPKELARLLETAPQSPR